MKNNKEQRELLKEIIGRLKEMQSVARKEAAESDSLIRWGRQSMIEEVLLMLYSMHDEIVDKALMSAAPEKEDSPLTTILSKPISFLESHMTHRAYRVLRNNASIVADIYGIACPLNRLMGCGRATNKEIIAGLKSVGLPDPDSKDTLNPEEHGFAIREVSENGRWWYKLED